METTHGRLGVGPSSEAASWQSHQRSSSSQQAESYSKRELGLQAQVCNVATSGEVDKISVELTLESSRAPCHPMSRPAQDLRRQG